MTSRVTVIGGGVIGLATAYALVREGFAVELIEAGEALASGASFANGGQLSYRYVAPLADAGVPWHALGWMLRGDSPLRLRPRMDPAQWRWLLAFMAACRGSVNRVNAARLLRLALHSQDTLASWREEDGLDGFAWRRNGKLVVFRDPASFAQARQRFDADHQQALGADEIVTASASPWRRACGPRGVAISAWASASARSVTARVWSRRWSWVTKCWRWRT